MSVAKLREVLREVTRGLHRQSQSDAAAVVDPQHAESLLMLPAQVVATKPLLEHGRSLGVGSNIGDVSKGNITRFIFDLELQRLEVLREPEHHFHGLAVEGEGLCLNAASHQ